MTTAARSAQLSPRAVRLAATLEERTGSTIGLSDLWSVWAVVDPAGAGRPEQRADLAATVAELVDQGVLTASAKQDRTANPALPTRLSWTARAASPSAAALARTVAWRPELSWVVSARLTLGQVETLRKINVWLRDRGRDDDVVPLRERSLEVLGREKDLDRAVTTGLFAEGRLTLGLLRTFRSHPPLPSRQVGDGHVLLVVENADTFHTVWTLLRDDPGPVGHVAWGAGGAFESSVVSVSDLSAVTTVRYFGDLDYDGLRIPHNANRRAAADGLPPVQPAAHLYELLLASGLPQPGQAVPASTSVAVADWLDAGGPLTQAAEQLLRSGCRLPQETVTRRLLADSGAWTEHLR